MNEESMSIYLVRIVAIRLSMDLQIRRQMHTLCDRSISTVRMPVASVGLLITTTIADGCPKQVKISDIVLHLFVLMTIFYS
jgi:hypothetical protein